jgi:hypothetical protein
MDVVTPSPPAPLSQTPKTGRERGKKILHHFNFKKT